MTAIFDNTCCLHFVLTTDDSGTQINVVTWRTAHENVVTNVLKDMTVWDLCCWWKSNGNVVHFSGFYSLIGEGVMCTIRTCINWIIKFFKTSLDQNVKSRTF